MDAEATLYGLVPWETIQWKVVQRPSDGKNIHDWREKEREILFFSSSLTKLTDWENEFLRWRILVSWMDSSHFLIGLFVRFTRWTNSVFRFRRRIGRMKQLISLEIQLKTLWNKRVEKDENWFDSNSFYEWIDFVWKIHSFSLFFLFFIQRKKFSICFRSIFEKIQIEKSKTSNFSWNILEHFRMFHMEKTENIRKNC